MSKSKKVKVISQVKLAEYYRRALSLAGLNGEQSRLRAWFIAHRTAKVQSGGFRLRILSVPTVSVNMDRLRRKVARMNPALRRQVSRALSGCTVRGAAFRVEVVPTRAS